MKRICVFLGSSPGARPEYAAASDRMAAALLRRGLGLVYGGAHVGLMGRLADAVLAGGGEVIGVIPRNLVEHEVAHSGLTRLEVVSSMHERKARMSELCDAVVAMPGGLGTLEELFEMLTWAQLGLHAKPCGLLDVAGYYASLARFLDHAVDERFLKPEHRALVRSGDDPDRLLDALAEPVAAPTGKWLDQSSTARRR